MRRRLLSVLLLLALALGVVAAAVARDPRAEQVRLKPADVALAKRITLKAGDLGLGTTRRPLPAAGNAGTTCAAVNPDLSAFTITGKAQSAFAHQATTQVLSIVEVFKSRAEAARDFRLTAKPQLAKCIRREIERELGASTLPIRVTSARVVQAPGVGEQRIAFRVVARIESGATKANIYADVISFQRGRSIALLSFMSPLKPYPAPAKAATAVAARMR
jgi:hypothetical protein